MRLALEQAKQAADQDEVPVGAVLVVNNEVLTQAHNQPILAADPTAHAELLCLRQAAKSLGNYRTGGTLYVTLQPCLMCLGALLHARVERVVVGSPDSRYASNLNQQLDLLENNLAWRSCTFETGCLRPDCEEVLRTFFKSKRASREETLKRLSHLADLPNVNKMTVLLLESLGLRSGQDFLTPNLSAKLSWLESQLTKLHDNEIFLSLNRSEQARQLATIKSLLQFLQGEPALPWKHYL